jgi:hypothetical protein
MVVKKKAAKAVKKTAKNYMYTRKELQTRIAETHEKIHNVARDIMEMSISEISSTIEEAADELDCLSDDVTYEKD